MNTNAFFESLARRAESDTAVVATLRRSLSHDPGCAPASFPLVEPFARGLPESDRRIVYLAAGLWATGQRRETGPALPLAAAMARLRHESGSASVEARFVSLLDADADELVWRLRHAVTMIVSAGLALDWPRLLADLLRWGAPDRHIQQRWARLFWAQAQPADAAEPPAAAAEQQP